MSCLVRVVTRKPKFANSNMADSTQLEIENTRDIDHDNPEDRRWLGKHCFWAMRSSRSVTTYPIQGA